MYIRTKVESNAEFSPGDRVTIGTKADVFIVDEYHDGILTFHSIKHEYLIKRSEKSKNKRQAPPFWAAGWKK